MSRRLVLLDVDETVIDRLYRTTVDEGLLRSAVAVAQEKGLVIGLNSDSPLSTLKGYAMRFGIEGPLVAERGALYCSQIGEVAKDVTTLGESFSEVRREFVARLVCANLPQIAAVLFGDVREWANRLPPPNLGEHSIARDAVLINGLRVRSFGLWVRRYDAVRGWCISDPAIKPIVEILSEVGRAKMGLLWDQLEFDLNPAYGLCVVHHPATKKAVAVRDLLERESFEEVYMIGDSINDHLPNCEVKHCAVANASVEYKALCAHLATKERTEGVIELLGLLSGS